MGIETLRIQRDAKKRCDCRYPTFVVDTTNRLITCGQCGAILDPFEAMHALAMWSERFEAEVRQLRELDSSSLLDVR